MKKHHNYRGRSVIGRQVLEAISMDKHPFSFMWWAKVTVPERSEPKLVKMAAIKPGPPDNPACQWAT
jgi:hypothetical protein